MPRICILSTAHNVLDDRVYYKQALSLSRRFKSIYMIMQGDSEDASKLREGISFIQLPRRESLKARILLIPTVLSQVHKLKPDICHIHDFELIFALPFLRYIINCKIIYDVHEVYPEKVLDAHLPDLLKCTGARVIGGVERFFARFAHQIITTDKEIARQFNPFCPNVVTIFNYPRLELFKPNPISVADLSKKYGSRKILIFVGNITENRGIFLMIQAMKEIKRTEPEALLLLIGPISDGLYRRAAEEIGRNDLADCIEFVGIIPHVQIVNYITIAKVGVVANQPTPKYLKNIPIKQFEYMACGVPVLGSDIPPIATYVTEAGCGLVFDPTSPKAMASSALEILTDEDKWQEMSRAGRKAVETEWNWDQMEKRLFAVYGRLIPDS